MSTHAHMHAHLYLPKEKEGDFFLSMATVRCQMNLPLSPKLTLSTDHPKQETAAKTAAPRLQ